MNAWSASNVGYDAKLLTLYQKAMKIKRKYNEKKYKNKNKNNYYKKILTRIQTNFVTGKLRLDAADIVLSHVKKLVETTI